MPRQFRVRVEALHVRPGHRDVRHRCVLRGLRFGDDQHFGDLRQGLVAAEQYRCRTVFANVFSDVDVLLTPSAPGQAPEGIQETGSSVFNRNWTLLGVPCVTIPAGRGAKGLPLGVQFVGAYDDDERVLRCADWTRAALDQK